MKLRIVTLTMEKGRVKARSEGGERAEGGGAEVLGWLADEIVRGARRREAVLEVREEAEGCVSG